MFQMQLGICRLQFIQSKNKTTKEKHMSKIVELTNYERVIKCKDIDLDIVQDIYKDGSFDALVSKIKINKDLIENYVLEGRHYHFKLIKSDKKSSVWEISGESTERFHNEGRYGAQFLLYWYENSGFSIEIDS